MGLVCPTLAAVCDPSGRESTRRSTGDAPDGSLHLHLKIHGVDESGRDRPVTGLSARATQPLREEGIDEAVEFACARRDCC